MGPELMFRSVAFKHVVLCVCVVNPTKSQALSDYGSAYGLKKETRQLSTNFLVSPTEKERNHTFV